MIMRKGKWLFGALSLLLFAGLFAGVSRQAPAAEDIFLQISYGETKQNIRCWQDEDSGIFWFFLPAGAETVTWQLPQGADFELDGVKLENGSACVFESGQSHILTETGSFFCGKKESQLKILRSENLASVYLTTDTGKMDYILEKKGNEEGGSVCFVTADGQPDYEGAFAGIKGRGNYTWLLDKKSFTLQFDEPVELLSLAEDSEWVLLAGACEDTHLINRMVFEMMRSAQIADVQKSTWIDLYLNGEYAGNYLLSQKVKPQKQELDGGWMVEFDGYWEEEGKPGFYTDAGETLAIGYPQKEQEGATPEKYQDIINFVQSVENAVLSEDGIDDRTGMSWQELADADSLVKKYILDEISKCPDGWNGSNYCFFRDGKMYFGAPWDYEFAFGNQPAWFSGLQLPWGLYHRHETKWYKELYEKPEFLEAVKTQYREFFEPYLRGQVKDSLDGQAAMIGASMRMDALRWGRAENEFAQKLENLKNFISDRLDWLDQEWLGIAMEDETPWYSLTLMDGESEYAVYYYRKGSFVEEKALERDDDSFTGWYADAECSILSDVLSEPVNGDITLYSGWNTTAARIRMIVSFLPLLVFLAVLLLLILWVLIK